MIMIEVFQFMVRFCFWFLLAIILLTLCGLGVWVLVELVIGLRRRL